MISKMMIYWSCYAFFSFTPPQEIRRGDERGVFFVLLIALEKIFYLESMTKPFPRSFFSFRLGMILRNVIGEGNHSGMIKKKKAPLKK